VVDLDEYPEMQFGDGCHIDQLLGQWWANSLDLGYVLPAEHVRTTLQNIYRNNRREGFRIEEQRPRPYLDGRDRGLYICSWPHGGKPENPTLYSDEVWSGLEYPLAAMLLKEGETDAAMTMLADIRDRHDGTRRSPWNEVECGDHYVRPMASWNLLEIASGYDYSALDERLRFAPRLWQDRRFESFWITGSGWGGVTLEQDRATLTLDYGSVTLRSLELAIPAATVEVSLGDRSLPVTSETIDSGIRIVFEEPVMLVAADTLTVKVGTAS
jgi:non-lysosomal glucosylceramidase